MTRVGLKRIYELAAKENPAAVATLREESRKGPVTLVFAAKVPEFSSARILKEYLEAQPKKRS